ncbi:hypothetical protein C8R46DRAFT_430234 [Mycena filopes]|nr:hypothetical protein C8R46DRAFT_430234 [Mycena filopes]
MKFSSCTLHCTRDVWSGSATMTPSSPDGMLLVERRRCGPLGVKRVGRGGAVHIGANPCRTLAGMCGRETLAHLMLSRPTYSSPMRGAGQSCGDGGECRAAWRGGERWDGVVLGGMRRRWGRRRMRRVCSLRRVCSFLPHTRVCPEWAVACLARRIRATAIQVRVVCRAWDSWRGCVEVRGSAVEELCAAVLGHAAVAGRF